MVQFIVTLMVLLFVNLFFVVFYTVRVTGLAACLQGRECPHEPDTDSVAFDSTFPTGGVLISVSKDCWLWQCFNYSWASRIGASRCTATSWHIDFDGQLCKMVTRQVMCSSPQPMTTTMAKMAQSTCVHCGHTGHHNCQTPPTTKMPSCSRVVRRVASTRGASGHCECYC